MKTLDAVVDAGDVLTWKQEAFVHFYCGISRGDAKDAIHRAGYRPTNRGNLIRYLLSRPAVQAAIREKAARVGRSSDEIVGRLSEIAFSDIADFIDPDTGMVSMQRMIASGKSHLVRKVTPTRNGPAIEMYNGLEALTLLAKFHGILEEKISVSITTRHLDALDDADLARIAEGKVSADEIRALQARAQLALPSPSSRSSPSEADE